MYYSIVDTFLEQIYYFHCFNITAAKELLYSEQNIVGI